MQRNSRTLAGLGAASALFATLHSGCGSGSFDSPAESLTIQTPASWTAASAGNQGRISTGWLAEFSDAGLGAVVDEALARNRNLKAAAARMRQAEEIRIAGRSRHFPRIGSDTSAGFSASGNGPAPSTSSERYGLTVAAAWEMDLWGRLRDLSAADDADLAGARADFRGARLSLAAATARAWCNLIAAGQQLELAKSTLDSYERNLRTIERIYKGTGQGALDVQLGRTNVSSAQGSVKISERDRDEAARTLELLLGRYPSAAIQAGKELPVLRAKVPSGLPGDLIERRPDLAAARARIFASARRADAARKSLLPSLSLTASGGTPVSRFAQLLDPSWLVASIGANISQPVFEGGALAAGARGALAVNEAAIHDYAQVALEAFREVESALSAEVSLAEQEKALVAEVEQAALAERQAERDYTEGLDDNILRVLESQRRATSARLGLIRLRNQRLLNRIDLHLALGGDFKTREFGR